MKRIVALVATVCLATGLAVFGAAPANAGLPPQTSGMVSARTLLAHLTVRAENYSHTYNRSLFSYDDDFDADGDRCYTRREVLKRDAIHLGRVSSSCAIYDSEWRSLYDDRITHDRGTLEIDHLVPIAEAWYSGAWAWSHRQQIAFGNDLGYEWDLQAVTSSLNQDKGAGDPSVWMPPKNHCTYVKAWIGVKARWGLSVDPAENAKLTSVLNTCASVMVLNPGHPNLTQLIGHGEVEPVEHVR